MPVKGAEKPPLPNLSALPFNRFRLITLLVFVLVLILSIDGFTIKPSISFAFFAPSTISSKELSWLSPESQPNFTENLLTRLKAAGGGSPCSDSSSADVAIPGLDGKDLVELAAGEIHEFSFKIKTLDESCNASYLGGGDYFEADLSGGGESWKSRPPIKDFGNGSYSISLQVHPDFSGDYNLTLILLFRHFDGLNLSPAKFVITKELRRVRIRFHRTTTNATLPELQLCQKSDFGKDVWSGRWTRHGKNDTCQISDDGRFRCLPPEFPCPNPWCNGSLGALESNGWVYSAHCSFTLFSEDFAWKCLKDRWIFFWGDSNHQDTIRNMMNFILLYQPLKAHFFLPRRFDLNLSNPRDPSQTVRITSIFNGHWNDSENKIGLDSLKNDGYKDLLKKYFSGSVIPDTIIMNSGLHDGFYWPSMKLFSDAAEYAASFWKQVMESVKRRGLTVPTIFYRTTVATGGYARSLEANPSKMEAFNGVILEKLRQRELISGVIDNFDMTFPWHFDNRCSEGQHYGRAPVKAEWADGQIGHQYFVDLMLGHVLLNALCVR